MIPVFFFQAEDGIRDVAVTGVQTCALPICYLDLFVGTWYGSKTNYLYHNNGDGTFTRVAAANIPKIPSNQHGSSWGDFDNDGYVDLMVTAGNPEISHNVVYRNNGDGTFTAITSGPIYTETTGFDVGFH